MTVEKQQDGRGIIKVQFAEDPDAPIFEYQIKSGLKDLMSGTSATVIASVNGTEQEGGAFYDATLLRVLEGQKSGYISLRGNVHKSQQD